MTVSGHPTEPRDSVAGLIERVTFHNEDTGFTVLRVAAKGARDLVTVVGTLPAAHAGEWIVAEGKWVHDREHGRQLQADTVTCTPPTTRAGIEKYLGSGMVKGIGPVYAKKLVDHFGEAILDVIEARSQQLEDVAGIGPARRRKIKEAWLVGKSIRQIMVFLHSHGVSTSRAVRIHKIYGDQAIETLRANPYVLAQDIPGIGFKTADLIAQRVGIPRDSLLRAEAGLLHGLNEAAHEGHCALPTRLLLEATVALLHVPESVVAEARDRLLHRGALVVESIEGEEFTFLPDLRQAELQIARTLCRLAQQPSIYPAIDPVKAIAWCETQTGKTLATSQRQALTLALRSRVMVITGGPGVGKTTLLDALLRILGAKGVAPTLCAPTGRAARRMSEATGRPATTMHRLLRRLDHPGTAEAGPAPAGLWVIDECSMVDVPLFAWFLRHLPRRAALLLVGDVDQLPSVGPGSLFRDVIQSGVAPVAALSEVFRQAAESQIIQAAHAINQGHCPPLPEKEKSVASDFYFVEREEPEAIAHTLLQMVHERIPQRFGLDAIREVQVLCPMNRGVLGVRELNRRLQALLNPARSNESEVGKFGWTFRPRDKVIQTTNNYDKDVFNGDVGSVTRVDLDEKELHVEYDGRAVVYDFGELDEIQLAYAMTVHKSQGSEFPCVVMPISTQHYVLLQRNLVYTGITRGRRLVVLVGQRKALNLAVRQLDSLQRYSGLRWRLAQGITST